MNDKRTILYAVLAFVVSTVIGWSIAHFVSKNSQNDTSGSSGAILNSREHNGREVSVGIAADTSATVGQEVTAPSKNIEGELPAEKSTVRITASTPNADGNMFSFRVSCSGVHAGETYHFELWSKKKIASSSNGIFSGIPESPTGKYKVVAISDGTGQILASIIVSGFKSEKAVRMSVAEFQTLLLNRKDVSLLGGKNKKVSRNISFSFVDMGEDKEPYDVQSIRDKIYFGYWKSAVVLSVGYDENDKINSATIRPVY